MRTRINSREFSNVLIFDRLMSDPLRGLISYPIKLKMAALLGVLRLIVWNKWECLIPVSELWAAYKLMALFVTVKNHEWASVFTRVVTDQFSGRLESGQRQELLDRIMPDLVTGNRAVQILIESWLTMQPIVEYIDVAQYLVDEESEDRRQTKLSQQLWRLLERGFAHDKPLDSLDLLA